MMSSTEQCELDGMACDVSRPELRRRCMVSVRMTENSRLAELQRILVDELMCTP